LQKPFETASRRASAPESGHVANVSSLSVGVFGTPFFGLYSASKFAVEALTTITLFLHVAARGDEQPLVSPKLVACGSKARLLT